MNSLNQYLKKMNSTSQKVFQQHKQIDYYKDKLQYTDNFENVISMGKDELPNLVSAIYKDTSGSTFFVTSGTSSTPMIIPYQAKMLLAAAKRAEKALKMGGVNKFDVILNAYGHGPFPPGTFYDNAVVKLGASLLPLGSGRNTPTQLKVEVANLIGVSSICCVPSYARRIAKVAFENKLPDLLYRIEKLFLGGEPLVQNIREEIQSNFINAKIYDQYGMAEAPMLAAECAFGILHFFSNAYIPEIYNFERNTYSFLGNGELTLTTRQMNSLPLLRYRTGDSVELEFTECRCGINGAILSRIHRIDSLRKIKGVLCSITGMADLLQSINEINGFVIEISKGDSGLDFLRIYVSLIQTTQSTSIVQRIKKVVTDKFIVSPDEISLVREDFLDQLRTHSGKIRSFVDLR